MHLLRGKCRRLESPQGGRDVMRITPSIPTGEKKWRALARSRRAPQGTESTTTARRLSEYDLDKKEPRSLDWRASRFHW